LASPALYRKFKSLLRTRSDIANATYSFLAVRKADYYFSFAFACGRH
jgi:hypothetical protein